MCLARYLTEDRFLQLVVNMLSTPIILFALATAGFALVVALIQLVVSLIRHRRAMAPLEPARLAAKQSNFRMVVSFLILVLVASVIVLGLKDRAEQWLTGGFVVGIIGGTLIGLFVHLTLRSQTQTPEGSLDDHFSLINSLLGSGCSVGQLTAGTVIGLVAGAEWLSRSGSELIGDETLLALAFGAGLTSLVFHVAASRIGAESNRNPDDMQNPSCGLAAMASIQEDAVSVAIDTYAIYLTALAVADWVASNLFGDSSLWQQLPLFMASITLASTMVSGWLISAVKKKRVVISLYAGTVLSLILTLSLVYLSLDWFYELLPLDGAVSLDKGTVVKVFGLGLGLPLSLSLLSEYFSVRTFAPARTVAQASESGVASTIVAGLSLGLKSSLLPIGLGLGVMVAAYFVGYSAGGKTDEGAFAVMLALTGMVSMFGAIGTMYAFAAGVRRVGQIFGSVRYGEAEALAGYLGNIGQSVQAASQGIILITGIMTGASLLVSYVQSLGSSAQISLSNPLTYGFLLLGGFLPCWFAGKLMDGGVRKGTAGDGGISILEGFTGEEPGTLKQALSRLPVPFLRTFQLLAAPLLAMGLVTAFADQQAQALVLVGGSIVSMLLAVSVLLGAGVWSSAKRRIELGHSGGVYSDAYVASLAGENVGHALQSAFAPTLLALVNFLLLSALLVTPLILTL